MEKFRYFCPGLGGRVGFSFCHIKLPSHIKEKCQADKFIRSHVCFQSRALLLVNQWDGPEDMAQGTCGSRLSQQAGKLEKGQLVSEKSSDKKSNINATII